MLAVKKSRANSVQLVKSEPEGRLHSNHPRINVEGGGSRYRRDAGSCGLSASDVLEMEPVSHCAGDLSIPHATPPLPSGHIMHIVYGYAMWALPHIEQQVLAMEPGDGAWNTLTMIVQSL